MSTGSIGMTMADYNAGNAIINPNMLTADAASSVSIIASKGYQEGAYVKWSPVSGATGYVIYRKTGNSSWKKIATVNGNNTLKYVDATAEKGKTYTYTVRARNGKYLSSYNTKGVSVKDLY